MKMRDPDDVERVPEQREAQDPAQDVGRKPLAKNCAIIVREPEQPDRDMQAVAADEGEEGREEGAALGPAPCASILANSFSSSARKARPSRPVTS